MEVYFCIAGGLLWLHGYGRHARNTTKQVFWKKRLIIQRTFSSIDLKENLFNTTSCTLQKQICCFDHRVSTMVEVILCFILVFGTNCTIGNQKGSALMRKHRFILQPQYSDNPQNICEGVFTNTLQSCGKELSWFYTSWWLVVTISMQEKVVRWSG